jgi:hypothetical protein
LNKLLAQKSSFHLKEQQDLYDKIPEFIIEEEINKYIIIFYKLTKLKEKMLKKYV